MIRMPNIIQIPSYNSRTLFYNPTVNQHNVGKMNDTKLHDEMEIEYTVRHPFAQYRYFNRYLRDFPDEALTSLVPYVFFVRPDLNILNLTQDDFANDAIRGDATIRWLYNNCPEIVRMLSTNYSDYHDYMPYLGSKVETFPTFDFSLQVNENTQAFTGYRNFYSGNAVQSTTGIQFDVTFKENNNLETLKLFFTWLYYIDGVVRNKFIAKDVYRFNRIADYYTSIYYFLCEPDGQKITYYQKITGAFPTNAPMSLLSMNIPMTPESKVNISFSAFYVEHMNPIILSEFNYNSRLNASGEWSRSPVTRNMKAVSHYDPILMRGKTFVGTPFVYSGDGKDYYLIWNDDLAYLKNSEVINYGTSSK